MVVYCHLCLSCVLLALDYIMIYFVLGLETKTVDIEPEDWTGNMSSFQFLSLLSKKGLQKF